MDIIIVMKDIFSRNVIPEELVSDNGSQYKFKMFKTYSTDCGFKHTTSSPGYHQSNGLTESAIKIMKTMIKKQLRSEFDITEGLLVIRNTPLQCNTAQLDYYWVDN